MIELNLKLNESNLKFKELNNIFDQTNNNHDTNISNINEHQTATTTNINDATNITDNITNTTDAGLENKLIFYYSSIKEIDSILIGMNKKKYVKDIILNLKKNDEKLNEEEIIKISKLKLYEEIKFNPESISSSTTSTTTTTKVEN